MTQEIEQLLQDFHEQVVDLCNNAYAAGRRSVKDETKETIVKVIGDCKDAHYLGYQKGLNDAWEAARTVYQMLPEELEDVFGYFSMKVLMELSATEVIELLKKKEEEQKKPVQSLAFDPSFIEEQMIKYGFTAPDMTATEFVEDILFKANVNQADWWKCLLGYKCSKCGEFCEKSYDFCPNCRSKMRCII